MITDILESHFILRALLAGSAVAILAGPLGCFVVWRRMAYFGDSLAHAALLGIALSFIFQVNTEIGIIASSLGIALSIALLRHTHRLAVDTLLGILAHSTLAIGVVALSFFPSLRFDLTSFLFGDILAVSVWDLAWIAISGLIILGILGFIWRKLLLMTLHEELAIAEGIKTFPILLLFMLIFAVFIAVAMKIVGVLLVTSMLLLPAATARTFSSTPERMAASAAAIGLLAVWGGIAFSYSLDTPTGPSIVVIALCIFVIILGFFGLARRMRLLR